MKYLLLLIASLLTGCSAMGGPAWYQVQGVSVINCGPAVSAMASSWAGVPLTVGQARAEQVRPMFWSYDNIQRALEKRSVPVSRQQIALPASDQMGIYHVDGVHFVTATPVDNVKITVYDPLGLIKTVKSNSFLQRVTQSTLLLVEQL